MSDNFQVRNASGSVIEKSSKQLSDGSQADKTVPIKGNGAEIDFATQATLAALLAAAQALAVAGGGIAVTKSDTTVLTGVRGIYVGTGGDVVATVGGEDFTFKNVSDGTTLPIKATKIKAATTAADIVALT